MSICILVTRKFQDHYGWTFGAIAELVDNSRDAKATILRISMDIVYSNIVGKDIRMLSVIDDGYGMTHDQILGMVTFGQKEHVPCDPDHIGRYGLGFKTGAMRLGKDALVLTQVANSRSIAFLSQTLNEGKYNLEIPIISYCRKGQFMEIDTSVQSKTLAKHNLRTIKKFSMFNEYLIGEKVGLFGKNGTGIQIYVWNLDKCESTYCLGWDAGMSGGSSSYPGDITTIPSQRNRSRPGQMDQKVPLTFLSDPIWKLYIKFPT